MNVPMKGGGAPTVAVVPVPESEMDALLLGRTAVRNFDQYVRNISSAEILKFFELLEIMKQRFDVYKTCNVQKCYEDRGLVVHLDFRGFGIAREFLKTRRLVCQTEGVPVTEGWMTSIGSQKAAERDGWQTAVEVPVEEFEQQLDVSFGLTSGIFKAMYAEIN